MYISVHMYFKLILSYNVLCLLVPYLYTKSKKEGGSTSSPTGIGNRRRVV